MMNIPSFSSGERLSAAKLNALADAVRELQREAAASRITSVNGGTFSRTAGGTSLDIHRVVPTPPPAAAAPSFDHPFKVSLIPPAEKGGKYRVKVQLGKVYYANVGDAFQHSTPTFYPEGKGYISADTAELPDGETWLALVNASAEYSVPLIDPDGGNWTLPGWRFAASGLFFGSDVKNSPSIMGCDSQSHTIIRVAEFSRIQVSDDTETVAVTQELFSDAFLPIWVPRSFSYQEQ